MKLLKVKHFRQTPDFCGPASIKIAASYFGFDYTEKELVKLSGCTHKYGTFHPGMIKAAKAKGFYAYVKEHSSLEEVDYLVNKEKLPVILGWYSTYGPYAGEHYSVAIGLDSKHLVTSDPERDESTTKLDREYFPSLWFDFENKAKTKIVWRWMIVITPYKRKFKVKGGRYY